MFPFIFCKLHWSISASVLEVGQQVEEGKALATKIIDGIRAHQATPSVHRIHMGKDKKLTIGSLSIDHSMNFREEAECNVCMLYFCINILAFYFS